MAYSIKYRRGLTGGSSDDLDAIVSSVINHEDASFTATSNKIYFHKYDSASTSASNSPLVIVPVDNPTSGRWILQVSPFDAILLPVSGSTVIGNIQGLEVNYISDDTINVDKGNCYDSFGTTPLTRSSAGDVLLVEANIASWVADGSEVLINKVYNVFVLEDGSVKFDTDVDGANISGKNRYRWFVKTDADGHLIGFTSSLTSMKYNISSKNFIGQVTNSYSTVDHSSFMPISRISDIEYGVRNGGGTQGYCVSSMDGVNVESYIGYSLGADSDTGVFAWGQPQVLLPFDESRMFKNESAGNQNLVVSKLILKI